MPDIDRLASALSDRYTIERELGAGGMATVYLAHDIKHDRDVAIKVLRPELAAVIGADRFLSEIKTTAHLQHPHILPLFDSGSADGFLFYVMPFVEGESLRDRLDREKQLPVDDAVRIAREVADALDYAHKHGVIHRDIKPENILLHDGRALVADFGIALAASKAGGNRMTETGMSLGTPRYMSPEQAMGEREITARSDIYALGCVTYEMLLGEPPFSGPTAQAIVAKVMTEKPGNIVARRERVPLAVEDAILTALEKLPADRFGTAAQFADALVAPASTTTRRAVTTAHTTWWQRHATPLIAMLAVTTLAATALAIRYRRGDDATTNVNRFALELGAGQALGPNAQDRLAWTPDGRAFAYVGTGPSGGSQIFLRSLDTIAATAISGTNGAYAIFVSPDGKQIGFEVETPFSLKIVPRAGGKPRTLVSDTLSGGSADWAEDGYIYFDGATSISRIRPDGTGREVIAPLDTLRNEIGVLGPQALPGGRGVIYRMRRAGDAPDQYTIDVVDLKSRTRKKLVTATYARYAPGYLLYALADGSLMASHFDLDHLVLTGAPILVARGVRIDGHGAADFTLSTDGSLLYSTGGGILQADPVWVTRAGAVSRVDSTSRDVFANGVALSPDGKQLAISRTDMLLDGPGRSEDTWVKQLPAGPLSRLTTEGEQNRRPSWSPDGRDVLFLSTRAGPPALYRQRADGSAPAERIATNHNSAYGFQGFADGFESPDGHWLVLTTGLGTPGDADILAMQIGVDTTPKPIMATRFQELAPSLSPDGRWLAYSSNETGHAEIYVRPFPEVGAGKIQVSTAGGTSPRWGHKGDELFYISADNEMISARVKLAPSFTVLGQTRLFSTNGLVTSGDHTMYDVTPDDQRFVMIRPGATADAKQEASDLILVQNFMTELKRELP
jgi:serine/threonine-protein kinase